jgi:hypothetical protein
MNHLFPWRFTLATLCVLGVLGSAPAAPLPPASGPSFEQYLLEDTNLLFVLDVKQARGSKLYTPNDEKILRTLLANPEAQLYLEGTGFDPLKDLDRFALFMSPSCFPGGGETPPSQAGPIFLLEGKFDPTRIHARLSKLAKEKPEQFEALEMEGEKVYILKDLFPPDYFIHITKDALVLAHEKSLLAGIMKRLSARKRPKLKEKELVAFLKDFDKKPVAQMIALSSSVFMTSRTTTIKNGMRTMTWKHTTLLDLGMTCSQGSLTLVENKILGRAVLTGKDAKTGKALAEKIAEGLNEIKQEFERIEELKPLRAVAETVKVEEKDGVITLTGQADREALDGLFRLMMFGGARAAPPPPAGIQGVKTDAK